MIAAFLAIYVGHFYKQDRDKRKLIFVLAFAAAALSYVYPFIEYLGVNTGMLGYRLFDWASVPLIIAVFVAANDHIFKPEKYDNILKIFVLLFLLCFMVSLIPINSSFFSVYLRMIVAIEITIVSLYGFMRSRNLSYLLFLLAIMSLSIGGMTFLVNQNNIGIFANMIGLIFLGLIFFIPRQENYGVSTYFTLQKKLVETKALLKTAIDQSPAGILIADAPDVKIRVANAAALGIRGTNAESLTNISVDKHVKQWQTFHLDGTPYEPQNLPLSRAVLRGEKVEDEEVIIKDVNGKKRYVVANASPIKDEAGDIAAGMVVFYDVTDRKKAEEQIKKAHQELQELNKTLEQKVEKRTKRIQLLLRQKDNFINQLGHDLKNPLGPLLNLLPLIEKKIDDDETQEILQIVQRNAQYINNLVHKTLELARLNSPKVTFNFTRINLFSIINDVIKSNQYQFQENHVYANNRVHRDVFVDADMLRVEELLNNLLNNAVKYSPEGGTIQIRAQRLGEWIQLSIKDEGQGMTKDQLHFVFDEFYKADESRHNFESNGLGMSICKRIVEKHGGEIWVESKGLGTGTTFYFTLPASKIEQKKQGSLSYDQAAKKIDALLEIR